jgi:hypothetical protein
MSETEEPEEEDGFGLDKDARLAAERAEAEEEARPEPLDPPFPYRVIAVDTGMVSTTQS